MEGFNFMKLGEGFEEEFECFNFVCKLFFAGYGSSKNPMPRNATFFLTVLEILFLLDQLAV